jgi:hypothetical protein
MSTFGWVAFGLGVANAVLWVAVVIAARQLYRRIKPQVEPYLVLVSGMFGSAAGTGDVENVAASSPAAVTPDRCEYEDHEWFPLDSPTMHGYDGPAYYCARCGFTERVPGT